MQQITPIELMNRLGWDYLRIACEFGVSEAAARRWAFSPSASNKRESTKMAGILASKIYKPRFNIQDCPDAAGLLPVAKQDDGSLIYRLASPAEMMSTDIWLDDGDHRLRA